MIGDLVRACEAGRADARAGRRRLPTWNHPKQYLAAYTRERRAMKRRGELPQGELFDTVHDRSCTNPVARAGGR